MVKVLTGDMLMQEFPKALSWAHFYFLLYINDLPNHLTSTVKLFADDVSLISVVHDPLLSAQELNHDLKKISDWSHKWRMSFNPDPIKQAIEVLFSKKRSNVLHPDLFFNGSKIDSMSSHKHLGMILDNKLDFNEHLSQKLSSARKGVGILRKLFYIVPRDGLLNIFKLFIRPLLDYGDFIYDKPNNESFINNIESIQYNAALAMTGTIKGTSKDKLYQELGLESLSSRRWFRRLITFYKIFKTKSPPYLYCVIPSINSNRNTRFFENICQLSTHTESLKNYFFANSIIEWNKLDISTRNLPLSIFKSNILKRIRPKASQIFHIHNPQGVKFLTRLRVSFSHLREHKFKHNFQDTINPLCNFGNGVECTGHFFLHCPFYNDLRQNLLNSINSIEPYITNLPNNEIVNTLLFGRPLLNDETNF